MDSKPSYSLSEASLLPREFSIGNEQYLAAWSQPFSIDEITDLSLLTVFEFTESGPLTVDWISHKIKNFTSTDDVFCQHFLESVLILHEKTSDLNITSQARSYLHGKGTRFIAKRKLNTGKASGLTSGPYLYSGNGLHPVWKLYEDTHAAFLHTLTVDTKGDPIKLHTAGSGPQSLTIAVPSRLSSSYQGTHSSSSSLQGWRIAVKDNFNIKNVATSACNRAYYELYPPSSKTAACIQTLYDAGATIVGTTKLASFAATEEPMECIDWQAPWNPRADRYQSPAGSSSGSGAAIATYPWLDIAIGSDTSGSGRRPGHWNGCFAMRPSHGYLSGEGLLESFPRFDVPTFFGRELEKCKHFAGAWYGDKLPSQTLYSKPYAIVYALDYMNLIGNQEQLKLIDGFVADLEKSLNVKHEKLSFEEAWESNPPSEANGQSLQEYMKDASRDSFFYEDYHNFGQFRKDYQEKFGKQPYVSPPVKWQWELSSHISKDANTEALKRLEVYNKWFTDVIMKPQERDTIVLIPIEEISPRYRDELPEKHFNPVGVPNLFLSPILKAPELTIPIGEYPFMSKVSGRTEKLPVAISMIGSPGQDLALFDVALRCLKEAGRPTRVLAGEKLFPEV